MKKLVSLLLAMAILTACAPMAAAQRSINNPDDAFVLPEKSFGAFQRGTADIGLELIGLVLRQLFVGGVEPEALLDLIRQLPLIKEGDALPPQREQGIDAFFDAVMAFDLGNLKARGGDVFLTSLFTGNLNSIYVALQETGAPDEYRFVLFYFDAKGDLYWCSVDILFNAKTGRLYSQGGAGLFALGYDYDLGQWLVRIDGNSASNRGFGFNIFYDIFSFLLGDMYITLRFPFEYDGREYMIQIWKGIFSLFADGGDIGIYERPKGRLLHWDSSGTELDMDIQVYRDGALLFDHGPKHSWWVGGFRVGPPWTQALPWWVEMRGSIVFEDPAMLDAFLTSFEKNRDNSITSTVEGMTFSFVWG